MAGMLREWGATKPAHPTRLKAICNHFVLAHPSSFTYVSAMNSRHRRTLAAVFKDPVSGTIAWADIESLLISVGCKVVEGSGSRVRFHFNGHVASFHRPHPAREAKRYQVRDAREFLL